jgi:hypothetical protein
MFNFDYPYLLLALVILNWPLYRLWGEVFFPGQGDFSESLYYWLVPDIVSLFRGEWHQDQWAQLRLVGFVLICAASVAAEYGSIVKLIEVFGWA